jgi:hypothetical protein
VAVDVVTLAGLFLPALRGWAVVVALALAVVALVQGLRPPVVRDYEVQLRGLPRDRLESFVLARDPSAASLAGTTE